jgi:hypothetical protein
MVLGPLLVKVAVADSDSPGAKLAGEKRDGLHSTLADVAQTAAEKSARTAPKSARNFLFFNIFITSSIARKKEKEREIPFRFGFGLMFSMTETVVMVGCFVGKVKNQFYKFDLIFLIVALE